MQFMCSLLILLFLHKLQTCKVPTLYQAGSKLYISVCKSSPAYIQRMLRVLEIRLIMQLNFIYICLLYTKHIVSRSASYVQACVDLLHLHPIECQGLEVWSNKHFMCLSICLLYNIYCQQDCKLHTDRCGFSSPSIQRMLRDWRSD